MPVWDLSAAAYANKLKGVSTQDTQPQDCVWSPDGAHLYVIGGANHVIYQYDAATPWDLSTLTYSGKSFNTGGQDISPRGIAIAPDGAKMWVGAGANRSVFQYTLTPGDLSTMAYTGKSFNVVAVANSPDAVDIQFNGAGVAVAMYVMGIPARAIYKYTFSTPGDVSTAVYAQQFDPATQDTAAVGFRFKPDGTVLFVTGDTNNTIYQYTLATPWDLSTVAYANKSFSVSTQATAPVGLAMRTDTGESMYVPASTGSNIYQYTLGVAPPPTRLAVGEIVIGTKL